jgi:hypothetical protein
VGVTVDTRDDWLDALRSTVLRERDPTAPEATSASAATTTSATIQPTTGIVLGADDLGTTILL